MNRYREFLKNQLRELLTNYGRIDELFLDFSYPGENGKGRDDWDSEGLIKLARQLAPHIIIDDRADLNDTDWGWDFRTPRAIYAARVGYFQRRTCAVGNLSNFFRLVGLLPRRVFVEKR